MTRPLIGLPGRRSSNANSVRGAAVAAGISYINAVNDAGGAVAVVPPVGKISYDELLSRFDGLLLHGGIDLSPAAYGESPHPQVTSWDDDLDQFEFEILKAAVKLDMPVLAICRGMQVLNVVLGGTLIQHIPDHHQSGIEHWSSHHDVSIATDSHLFGAVGSNEVTSVSSFHHQAVSDLGRNLRAVAWSKDKLVEGIEHESAAWIVGVQWHPEDKCESTSTKRLFHSFVQACIRNQSTIRR